MSADEVREEKDVAVIESWMKHHVSVEASVRRLKSFIITRCQSDQCSRYEWRVVAWLATVHGRFRMLLQSLDFSKALTRTFQASQYSSRYREGRRSAILSV